tara:strand:+ start:333 stop:674 length:342 start_codon:yes stop_codon:yes gene_type:complete
MKPVEYNISKKDMKSIDPLDWRKKDTILEWAARYEIKHDERLYQSLHDMKKAGGTLAMKTFWKCVRDRVAVYDQIIETKITQRVEEQVSKKMFYLIITNISFLTILYFKVIQL